MSETVVKELDALEEARQVMATIVYATAASGSALASAYALIAIAEELRELNAQLKRDALSAQVQRRNNWRLP